MFFELYIRCNCNINHNAGHHSMTPLQLPLLPQPNVYVNNKIASKLKNTLNFSNLNNDIRYGGQIGFSKAMPRTPYGSLTHSWKEQSNRNSSNMKSPNTAVVL